MNKNFVSSKNKSIIKKEFSLFFCFSLTYVIVYEKMRKPKIQYRGKLFLLRKTKKKTREKFVETFHIFNGKITTILPLNFLFSDSEIAPE